MNLVFISFILFALIGFHTCADLQKSSPSPASKLDEIEQHGKSLSLASDKKENEKSDHAGNHDQDDKSASTGSSIKARKGVNFTETDDSNVKATDVHVSNDRASTTVTKTSESVPKTTAEISSPVKTKVSTERTSSYGSDKTKSEYSPSDSKSVKTDTSSSANVKENNSTSSNYSKSSATSESISSSISSPKSSSKSSFNLIPKPKPNVTISVEDDPTLRLNIPMTRQIILPLTPTDEKLDNSDYIPSSGFVLDRMGSKREMYIFPLVVLIFLVPMVLGVGIIILRRVRDYWSTRHYRRMDFLVDGMYNT